MSAIRRALGFYKRDECEKFYKFGKTLGQGSFATVKAATCKADQSKWAIKCIKKSSLSAEDEEALQTEVEILERVAHPNIVQLREVFDCAAQFYMVMEVCSGGELFDRIVEKEHYTEAEARDCLRPLIEAIKYCHDNHIVHRDLKPENLLYGSEEDDAIIKIADFGLAKLLDDNSLMHTACGTPGYVAPEILEGRAYGEAVDMWSFGVILYILLCGFPPFYDENNAVLFRAIKAGNYDYPSPFWDDVSEDAKDLINNMLVVNPDKRFNAQAVLDHPWVTGDHSDKGHLGHFTGQMRAYNARRKFRAGILTMQALMAMGGRQTVRAIAHANHDDLLPEAEGKEEG